MAKNKSLPVRSKDVPATLGMLHIVRDELKSEMTKGFLGVDGKLAELKSDMARMSSSMHQMLLLAEEQRAENRIVMDGLTSLFSRQERVEASLESVEKSLADLKR